MVMSSSPGPGLPGCTACIRASHKQTSCIFIIPSASSPSRDLVESVRRWCHFLQHPHRGQERSNSRDDTIGLRGLGMRGNGETWEQGGSRQGRPETPAHPRFPPQRARLSRGRRGLGSQGTANASNQQPAATVNPSNGRRLVLAKVPRTLRRPGEKSLTDVPSFSPQKSSLRFVLFWSSSAHSTE